MPKRIRYMDRALELAALAKELGEVPVGAVAVYQDEIIAEGYNQPIATNDCTAHAEIIALRKAGQILGNYRLPEVSLYVTLEPCPMCAGAILHARIKKLYFATEDPRTGAAGSAFNLLNNLQLNHQVEVHSGLLREPARELLQTFFRVKREQRKVPELAE